MSGKSDKVPSSAAPARGRNVAAKPLTGTNTAARPKATSTGTSVPRKPVSAEPARQRLPSASSAIPAKASGGAALGNASRAASSGSRGPATDARKSSTKSVSNVAVKSAQFSTSSTPASSAKPPPSATLPPPIEEPVPTLTSDPLQVAAQLYPWLYMTSTLEACFQTAEETAKKDLQKRSEEIDAEESDFAEQRERYEAEQVVNFYDELSTEAFAKEAPHIMQTFLSHGDDCEKVEAEALQLATSGCSEPDEDEPLKIYNDMLDDLEKLQDEAVNLEASIVRLTTPTDIQIEAESAARAQIVGVFAACLPVLRARIANLSMAQELIDSAQENLSITLRMESLGLEL